MMRAGISVVACALVQRSDFARLADFAERFESSMDRCERDPRMLSADQRVDALRVRMVARFEQRTHHGDPLRRDGHLLAPAVGDEFDEPAASVIAAALLIDESYFTH